MRVNGNAPNEGIFHIYKSFFLALAIGFLFILSMASTLFTLSIHKADAPSSMIFISFFPILIGIVAWLLATYLLVRFKRVPKSTKTAIIAFTLGLMLSTIWIFVANSGPTYDSLDLSCAALRFPGTRTTSDALGKEWAQAARNVWGIGWKANTTQYSYMGRFPHQVPYVLLLWACQLLAGDQFALVAQLLNALANAFAMYLICKIVEKLGGNDAAVFSALGLLVSFCPLILFSTFIYGNLVCLPFGLGAWLLCLIAEEEGLSPKRRMALLLGAAVLIAAAILLKSTMKILAIAFAIAVLVFALRKCQWSLLAVTIMPLLLASLLLKAALVPIEAKTGTDLNNPVPMSSFIVMGTGAGLEYEAWKTGTDVPPIDLIMPGYFDAYVWKIPNKEGYTSWGEMNQKAFQLRIERFTKDPKYALDFLRQKLSIEWLEPTFECFVVSNYEGREEGAFATRLADDHRPYTFFAKSIYYGKANKVLTYIADLAQSLIAVGALVWCLCAWRRRDGLTVMVLLSLVFILGAALLYVFWENKSQYILPYYLFLIPYAACGWNTLRKKAAERVDTWKEARNKRIVAAND